jgi:hypothetical protein
MASTNNTGFRLALKPGLPYNFTINWGDGIEESYNFTTGNTSTEATRGVSHRYKIPNIYQISIRENVVGGFPGLNYTTTGVQFLSYDAVKLVNVDRWSKNTFGGMANEIENMFFNCKNLQLTATDSAGVFRNIVDFDKAWLGCTSLNNFPLIDTSSGQSFIQTWENCTSLTNFPQLSPVNAKNFFRTWYNCTGLTGFSPVDMRNAETIQTAWYNCTNLRTFPNICLSSAGRAFGSTGQPAAQGTQSAWENCTSMRIFETTAFDQAVEFNRTWYNCTALTSFPVIYMPKALTLYKTWQLCTSLRNFPLIDTTSVNNSMHGAWADCTSLTDFPSINLRNAWDFGWTWYRNINLSSFSPLSLSSGRVFYKTWMENYRLKYFKVTNYFLYWYPISFFMFSISSLSNELFSLDIDSLTLSKTF